MRSKASAILLVAGLLFVFIALNLLFLVDNESDQENERTGSRSSYRPTPFGTLAYYTLLEESGYPVTRFERPLTDLDSHKEIGTLVIISPPQVFNPAPEEFASLNAWVEKGGLLIVIDREIEAGFRDATASTEGGDFSSTARPLQPTRYTRGVSRVALSEFASRITIDSRSVTYHVGNERAAVLADASVGKGRIVLLADPFVVANNGIDKADNVLLALNLFADRPDGKIAFDEYHHGYGRTGQGGIMAYFRGTPVPWMMAQGALIAALVIYSFGRRFARPVPLRRERRTTNLEFVSSMANITRLARATDLAMRNIYIEFRNRLCRYSGLPSNVPTSKLSSAVARRAGLDPAEIGRLLDRCERVVRGEPVSDSELLALTTRIREIESSLRI
ncbi:MAG TPA: DUF4350 domain-containing protein [Blastocatellia bacterium]|nr:DUF4350 domain-containing protein [Blastocatellia bacterium]